MLVSSTIVPGFSNSQAKLESYFYEISFPPGPMGLELEPVIISSERQIGCRVRDFYFELEHDGIPKEELTSKVSPGDILWFVGGENVLSSKFDDILNTLRNLKSTWRIVKFKKMTTVGIVSCGATKTMAESTAIMPVHGESNRKFALKPSESFFDKENSSESASFNSPANKTKLSLSPRSNVKSMDNAGPTIQAPRFAVPKPPPLQTRSQLFKEISNQSRPQGPSQKQPATPGPAQTLRHTSAQAPAGGDGFGRFIDKALSPAKVINGPSQSPLMSSVKKRKQDVSDSVAAGSPIASPALQRLTASNNDMSMTLSPAKVKQLSKDLQHQEQTRSSSITGASELLSISAEDTPSEPHEHPSRRRRNRSLLPTIPPELVSILGSLGASIGSGLLEVGKDVGIGATNAALTVGSVVGDQAERLVDQATQIVPRYSEVEVRSMVEKKNTLLNELARTSMLLGAAHDKQSSLEEQAMQLRSKETLLVDKLRTEESRIAEMNSEIRMLRAENQHQQQHYNSIVTENQLEIAEWKRLSNEYKDRCTRLLQQLESSENAVIGSRDELTRERALFARSQEAWENQLQRVATEQANMRDDVKSTVNSIAARLREVEFQKDHIESEFKTARETFSNDLRVWTIEKQTLQQTHTMQIDTLKELLGGKEAESAKLLLSENALKSAVHNVTLELQSKCQEFEELELANKQTEAELRATALTIQLKDVSISELKESLKGAHNEVDSFRAARATDQSRISEAEEMLEFYRSQIAGFTEREITQTSHIEELSELCARQQQQFSAKEQSLCEQIENLNQNIQAANEANAVQCKEKEVLLSSLQELQGSSNQQQLELSSSHRQLQLSFEEKCIQLEAVSKLLQEQVTVSGSFEKKIEQLSATNQSGHVREIEMKQRIQQLESDVASLQATLSQEGHLAANREEALQAKVAADASDFDAMSTNLNIENKRLRDELSAAIRARDDAGSSHRTAYASLEDKYRKQGRLLESLQLQVTSKLTAARHAIAMLRRDLATQAADQHELGQLHATICRANKQANDVNQKLTVANTQEIDRLRLIVSDTQLNLSEAFERARLAEANTIAVEEKHLAALTRLADAEGSLRRAEASNVQTMQINKEELLTLQQKLQQLEEVNALNKCEIQELTNSLRILKNENNSLIVQLENEAVNTSKISILYGELQGNAESTAALLIVTTSEREILVRQFAEYREESEAKLQQQSMDIVTMLHNIEADKEKLAMEQEQRKAIENELQSMAAKLNEACEEHRVNRLKLSATAEGRITEIRNQHAEEITSLRGEIMNLKSQVQCESSEFVEDRKKLDAELTCGQAALQLKQNELDTLQASLTTAIDANHKLELENSEFRAIALSSFTETGILKEELTRLQAKLDRFQVATSSISTSPLRSSTIPMTSDLNVTYNTETETLNALEAENAMCKANLAAIHLELTMMRNNRDEMSGILDRAKQELSSTKQLHQGAAREVETIQQEFETAKITARSHEVSTNETISALKSQIEDKTSQIDALELQLRSLTSNLQDNVQQIQCNQRDFTLVNNELTINRKMLEDSKVEMSRTMALVQFHDLRAQTLLEERETISRRLEEMEEEHALVVAKFQFEKETVLSSSEQSRQQLIQEHDRKVCELQVQLGETMAALSDTRNKYALVQLEVQASNPLLEKIVVLSAENASLMRIKNEIEIHLNEFKAKSEALSLQLTESDTLHQHQLESEIGKYKRNCDDLTARLCDEQKDYEVLLREKELLEKNLLKCQLEVVTYSDSLLGCMSEIKTLKATAAHTEIALSSLKVVNEQHKERERELTESQSNLDRQLTDCAAQISALTGELGKSKAELETTRLREREMLSVIVIQTNALQQAENRECEYHNNRQAMAAHIAESELRSKELVVRAIAAEKAAVQKAFELDRQTVELNKALLEAQESKSRLQLALTKKRSQFDALASNLENMIIDNKSPIAASPSATEADEQLIDSEVADISSESVEAADLSALADDVLLWHDQLFSCLLNVHQSIATCFQCAVSSGITDVQHGIIRSLVLLSETFDEFQQRFIHAPILNPNEPLPDFPRAPHKGYEWMHQKMGEGLLKVASQGSSGSSCEAKPIRPSLLDKENDTPPTKPSTRRRHSTLSGSDAILVARRLVEFDENGDDASSSSNIDAFSSHRLSILNKCVKDKDTAAVGQIPDTTKAETFLLKLQLSEHEKHQLQAALNRAEDTIAALCQQLNQQYDSHNADCSGIASVEDATDDFWNLSSDAEEN